MKITIFKEEFIRRSLIVFLAIFFSGIVAFFANLYISISFGPNIEYFGNFKTIIYLFAFLPMIVDFGISSSLTKYVAEFGRDIKKIRYVIFWFLKIRVISYVILVALTFLLKDYIAFYFLQDASLDYLVIGGIFLMISNFFAIFSSIILGFQNFKIFSLSAFLSTALADIFAILLIPLGIFYMIMGWSLGLFLGYLPSVMFVLKKNIFSGFTKIEMKKLFFKFSLPIYPIDLSSSLFTAIIPILSLFFSQRIISYYSFAFMFYYVTTLIPSSLSSVLFPKISELNGLKKFKDARNILKRAFLYYSPIAAIGLIFVFLFSEWFITSISKYFIPSLLIFKVLVYLGFVFGFNVIYTNYLKGLGKVKKYALFTLFQNILLILVSFILLDNMV